MKKSILAIAVAATMAAPAAVMAAPTVYGNVHLSINAADNDVPNAENNLALSSNTSSLGVKGSEDLGDGLKAIYNIEFGVDIANKADTTPDSDAPDLGGGTGTSAASSGTLNRRDQFVGLKGGFGTVKFGTMSSNYKQMGGKVDPLYRTPLEGRGFLKTQSAMHGGAGIERGRSTNTIQYTSPKMDGISLVANTTMSGSKDETNGLGIRWSNKSIMAYADWIDGLSNKPDPTLNGNTQSAIKLGGKFHTKAFSVALQFEDSADRESADYIFLAGTFNINKNNMIALTYGTQERVTAAGAPSNDSTGLAVAYNHKLSKMTNVYAGYGTRSEDAAASDESMLTFGIRKKF
ncbi:MAG: porin [Gammaproteobacteria bacterium]|nr:porin [Gammaproteobacteria bacterium]